MANETKIRVLDLLSDGRWWTAPEVATQLGLALSNASERLRYYHHQHLLRRHRVRTKYNPPRLYEYQITATGLGRLEYLTSYEVTTGRQVGVQLGLKGKRERMLADYISKKLGR